LTHEFVQTEHLHFDPILLPVDKFVVQVIEFFFLGVGWNDINDVLNATLLAPMPAGPLPGTGCQTANLRRRTAPATVSANWQVTCPLGFLLLLDLSRISDERAKRLMSAHAQRMRPVVECRYDRELIGESAPAAALSGPGRSAINNVSDAF
jgi:hypothetical protein